MKARERKKPPAISRLFLVVYLSKQDIWIKVSLFITVCSLIMHVFRIIFSEIPFWLAMGSLIFGSLALLFAVMRYVRDSKSIKFNINPLNASEFEEIINSVKMPEELIQSGYIVITGGLVKNIINGLPFIGASAVSAKVNKAIWEISEQRDSIFETTLPITCRFFPYFLNISKKWKLPEISKKLLFSAIKSIFRDTKLTNGGKIRLRTDLHPNIRNRSLIIERTDYISDLVTGQITGLNFIDHDNHLYYNGLDLPFEYRNNNLYLKLCNSNSCSNQIGVSSLIVAVSEVENMDPPILQGDVFIIVQAPGNLQSPGLLAPSGSGSLDWSDYKEFENSFVVEGMLRELFEETTKQNKWDYLLDRGCSKTFLTGYGRMLHRGGKPEFYGLLVMPRKNNEKGVHKSEENFVSSFESIKVWPLNSNNLVKELQTYRNKNEHRLSHPLFLNMLFTEEFLKTQSVEFEKAVSEAGKYWHKNTQRLN